MSLALPDNPLASFEPEPRVHRPRTSSPKADTGAFAPEATDGRTVDDGLVAADAVRLYARLLAARSVAAAAHALVAALAHDLGLSRATLGLHQDGRLQLVASSHLDVAKGEPETAQALLGAMEEAVEQGLNVAWPAPAAGPADDLARVHFETEALQRRVGGAVAVVPLGLGGDAIGALCIEREAEAAFSVAELERVQRLLVLAAPALRWMREATDPWSRRTRRDLAQCWSRLRQPEQRTRRRLIAIGLLAIAFLALAPLQRDVGGRARVEGAEQRVLVAPADGFVKATHVRPGDRVQAGQVLVDLLDGDLRLERERWASQLAQHENGYAAAMAKADRATASTSLARIEEAQAQLALVDEQLARGRVVAPFDGLVIQGDLSQAIGAPVHQGDTLLTLATTGRHRVIVEVDEVDIEHVRPGQIGHLSLSSLPWGGEDLVVERITPLAKAVDGRNVFEVEARLAVPRTDLRPGLIGRGRIVVGRMPPLWAWVEQVANRARVAWWAWLG